MTRQSEEREQENKQGLVLFNENLKMPFETGVPTQFCM